MFANLFSAYMPLLKVLFWLLLFIVFVRLLAFFVKSRRGL